MAQRNRRVVKTPEEILKNVFLGHSEALTRGSENGKRYLVNFLENFNSIPNAVKFFIYDLLVEDAYQIKDLVLCRQAVERAGEFLAEAQAENKQDLAEYLPALRFIERGISITVESGEFETALAFCDRAMAMDLGKVYVAKKASIEKML
ncbi:MAG: hypothetical protein KJ915_02695 [Candidatus Omnitrophica bacterium]|nr:hypothetical protein [Candidatus Omnitrophota bacterium]